jgi:hypothetical protein
MDPMTERPAGASGTTSSTTAAACVLTPEVTEGPYYIDLDNAGEITVGVQRS